MSTLIPVSDVPITGKPLIRDFSAEELQITEDLGFQLAKPVRLEGEIAKTGGDVLIRGQLNANIQGECHRCLEPFQAEIQTDIELFYEPEPVQPFAASHELNEKELGTMYYRQNIIDLAEAVRDTIILELPIQLLCQKNCKGLCGKCGENLNQQACRCQQQAKPEAEASASNPFKDFFEKQKKSVH